MIINLHPAVFVALTLSLSVEAHLDVNSLSIKGGESFSSGETLTITWKMDHAHNYYHFIYLKNDSLATWNLIDSVKGQSGSLSYSYTWTVPPIASNSAQIRVFLPEFSKTPSEKTDQFTLISKPFSISPPTATFASLHTRAYIRHPDGIQGTIELTFDLKGRVVGGRAVPRTTGWLVSNRRMFYANPVRF